MGQRKKAIMLHFKPKSGEKPPFPTQLIAQALLWVVILFSVSIPIHALDIASHPILGIPPGIAAPLLAPSVHVYPKLGPLAVGGNADDPAIWIHPSDRARSLIFLSDKEKGIYVYDIHGQQLQHVDFGTRLNNIDVRYGFQHGDEVIDIVAGNLREAGKLAVLQINPDYGGSDPVRVLADKNSSGNDIQSDSYGFTLYQRPPDGAVFLFEKPKGGGKIRQYRILSDGSQLSVKQVREINDVSIGKAEGFVADDELGFVYFAEESEGIHKYNADPDHPNQDRLSFFAAGDGISGDREGLAIYKCNNSDGYLLLSSQGNSSFKVYERGGDNQFVKTFTADQADGTDGLDVSSYLVPGFLKGFAVIHDDPGAQYYLYDWADIAESDLTICPDGDPIGPKPTPTSPIPSETPPPTKTPAPGGDSIPPQILSFDVQPRHAEGQTTVSWSASDSGGSHLDRVEIWRAADLSGQPDPFSWHQRPLLGERLNGEQEWASGEGTDTPPEGTWWYRLQISDINGNWTFSTPIQVFQNQTPPRFDPFGTVSVNAAFEVDGAGSNIDSIAFWEAPDPADSLMFVTAKANDLVEVWKHPFLGNERISIDVPHGANGVLVDQNTDLLYVGGGGEVSRFSLPDLQPQGKFGPRVGSGETNLALLYHNNGETWLYVTSDHQVDIINVETGVKQGTISPPVTSIETVLADSYHQIVYVPEEQGDAGNEGIFAYQPDGSPYQKNGSNRFGNGPFQADEEGILLYTCPADGTGDKGTGLIIVSDQKTDMTDFEIFNRKTWEHLGSLRVSGVANTDGIASTQRALPEFPSGVFAAVDNDTSTAVVPWDRILQATGLQCGSSDPGGTTTFTDVPQNHWGYPYIEALYQNGFIAGCRAGPQPAYCPSLTLTRAEGAVFIVRGIHGAGFLPPNPSEQTFADEPLSSWSAKWSGQLWKDGYTAGCALNPLKFCPYRANSIAEGSVFLLRMLHGPNFQPPVPNRPIFSDLPQNTWYEKWIMAAFEAGLITACRGGDSPEICPNDPLNRAMVAYMMTVAKNVTPIE